MSSVKEVINEIENMRQFVNIPELKYMSDNINLISNITFEDVLTTLHNIYKRKNADYGNSFDKSLDEFGLIASVVRMSDKMERIKSLISKDAEVKDESIDDTLMDLANYAIMTILWLKRM